MLTADQFGQVFGFLLGGGVDLQLVNAQVGVRAVGEPDGSTGPGDLLHGDTVGQVAHTAAAIFFRYGNAQQAHIAEFLPQVVGKLIVVVDLGGAWGNLTGGKGVDLLTQHVQFIVKTEI